MDSDYNVFPPGTSRRALPWVIMLAVLTGCATSPEAPPEEPGFADMPIPVLDEPQPQRQIPLAEPEPARTYVVQRGDTLWGIAERFLRDPWHWPEVWHINPDVENPHLIYPGDVLQLTYREGRPEIRRIDETEEPELVEQAVREQYPTVKLSPRIREESIDAAIPTLPLTVIGNFLSESRVVDRDEMRNAAYILRPVESERLMAGTNDRVYVRNLRDQEEVSYHIVRAGREYVDPDTGDVLGQEAQFVGALRIQEFDDPAIGLITRINREIRRGDLLLVSPLDELRENFIPRPPEEPIRGRIIAVFDGVAQIGQYQVVTLNRGNRDGLEPGNVLVVMQAAATVRDERANERVRLKDQPAGEILVFRTYNRISYALVMRASRAMHINDVVISPP